MGMAEDRWGKRALFRDWVADAKAKLTATSNAEVAPVMGLTPNSLNKYLGKSPTHRPSGEALKLLGDFLGRDYRLLLDDPLVAPDGAPGAAWANATEDQRIFADLMLHLGRDLTPEERKPIIELAKTIRGMKKPDQKKK